MILTVPFPLIHTHVRAGIPDFILGVIHRGILRELQLEINGTVQRHGGLVRNHRDGKCRTILHQDLIAPLAGPLLAIGGNHHDLPDAGRIRAEGKGIGTACRAADHAHALIMGLINILDGLPSGHCRSHRDRCVGLHDNAFRGQINTGNGQRRRRGHREAAAPFG